MPFRESLFADSSHVEWGGPVSGTADRLTSGRGASGLRKTVSKRNRGLHR